MIDPAHRPARTPARRTPSPARCSRPWTGCSWGVLLVLQQAGCSLFGVADPVAARRAQATRAQELALGPQAAMAGEWTELGAAPEPLRFDWGEVRSAPSGPGWDVTVSLVGVRPVSDAGGRLHLERYRIRIAMPLRGGPAAVQPIELGGAVDVTLTGPGGPIPIGPVLFDVARNGPMIAGTIAFDARPARDGRPARIEANWQARWTP